MPRIRLRLQLERDDAVAPPGWDVIFNMHAAHTARQMVLQEPLTLSQDGPSRVDTDPVSGNRSLRLRAHAGPLRVGDSATVDLLRHKAWPMATAETPVS